MTPLHGSNMYTECSMIMPLPRWEMDVEVGQMVTASKDKFVAGVL